eukprot:354617-Chlamydomonas_euryale.AAC.5
MPAFESHLELHLGMWQSGSCRRTDPSKFHRTVLVFSSVDSKPTSACGKSLSYVPNMRIACDVVSVCVRMAQLYSSGLVCAGVEHVRCGFGEGSEWDEVCMLWAGMAQLFWCRLSSGRRMCGVWNVVGRGHHACFRYAQVMQTPLLCETALVCNVGCAVDVRCVTRAGPAVSTLLDDVHTP